MAFCQNSTQQRGSYLRGCWLCCLAEQIYYFMSSKIVHGKNVDVYEWSDPDEYIIICAKSCTFTRTFDVIETTHYSSQAKEFTTGMYEWEISLDGYVTIEQINSGDKVIRDYLVYGGKQTIRVRFTDNESNEMILQGDAIFPGLSITADVADNTTFSMTLKGTGPLTVS